MPVQFSAISNGQQYIDGGFHDVTVSNAQATIILTKLGLPTTVPGQADAESVYDKLIAYQESPEGQALSQAQKDALEHVRWGVALAWRCHSVIDWR